MLEGLQSHVVVELQPGALHDSISSQVGQWRTVTFRLRYSYVDFLLQFKAKALVRGLPMPGSMRPVFAFLRIARFKLNIGSRRNVNVDLFSPSGIFVLSMAQLNLTIYQAQIMDRTRPPFPMQPANLRLMALCLHEQALLGEANPGQRPGTPHRVHGSDHSSCFGRGRG